MKAIIIAAGCATRLGKYTEELPKGLLNINGKTILEKQISLFKQKNINDITIIVGPHKEKFDFTDVKYVEDHEYQKHDVLQSLMVARDSIKDDVIITYSDIIFDDSVLDDVIKSKAKIGLAIDLDWEKNYINRTEHPKSEADNVIIQNEKIIKIEKNILSIFDGQKLGEFIGIIKLLGNGSEIFHQEFNKIEKNHLGSFHNAPSFDMAYLTDMIQELIDNEYTISPIIINGKWCEIDTFQDLQKTLTLFK